MKSVRPRWLSALTLSCLAGVSCSDDGLPTQPDAGIDAGLDGTVNPDSPNKQDGGDATAPCEGPTTLQGKITADVTVGGTGCNVLLKGVVDVVSPATVTIKAGTTVKGENASKAILLIEMGAKLMAVGTMDNPIVFTSQLATGAAPGDWGGVVILGKAPTNWPGGKGLVEGFLPFGDGGPTSGLEYGGTDANDNSGQLSFVRIEYAGVIVSPGNEVNGLTLGGVGAGTKLDHIMVRQALDDCFEFFGGTVNAKYLACQYNQDDSFDMDNGFVGKLQFLVTMKLPGHTDEDNGFEVDNDANSTTNTPLTAPTIYNATICGMNAEEPTKQQYGFLLRRNTRGHWFNIISMGFEANLDIRNQRTGADDGTLDIQNSIFWTATGTGVVETINYVENSDGGLANDDDLGLDEVAWVKTTAKNNKIQDPTIADCFNPTTPVFGPTAPVTGATPPSDGFFDTTANYVGAFKDANDKWATTGAWVKWSNN